MKLFNPAIKLVLSVFLLATTWFPSFSQVRGLKAVADTIDLYPGIPVVFDILANDSIPAGSYIKAVTASGAGHVQCQRTHDSTWTWTFTFVVPKWGFGGELPSKYFMIALPFDTCTGNILYRIHDKSYGYLDVNNVSARFNSSGLHFLDENSGFEVPKGSGKTSLFSNSFWIGGKDAQKNLHFAGERYRQGGYDAMVNPDFYAGPVMNAASYSAYTDTVWNYIWNLKKSDIAYHRAHYWEQGYKPVHDILTWPGNGNPALGQAARLAPFSDRNGNGMYEPFDGDYPEIRGDQALFFIFNDDRGPHLESQGDKLRVEIHGMAYAFDLPGDSALSNTVFLYYKIVNRSQNIYDSTFLGAFSDIDIGWANDDFIGCDVERNMYFGYNGTPVDGTGQSFAYGANPPAQSVAILAGPYMDPDGIDNPRFGPGGAQLCDNSLNGANFGDSVADNERFGLSNFLYFNDINTGVPEYMSEPYSAPAYYNYLCGKWLDQTTMIYGGMGHATTGGYGPECRFMYPGESDTLNWGSGCTPPNGQKNWTETTISSFPGNRRGLGVSGPFTFHPGDIQDLDIAFTWARDYAGHGPSGSLEKLRLMADIVSKAFNTNRLPDGNPFYGIGDHGGSSGILFNVYPNPAADNLTIVYGHGNSSAGTIAELLTSQGNCVKRVVMTGPSVNLDVSGMPAGLYGIRITTRESVAVKTVIVVH